MPKDNTLKELKDLKKKINAKIGIKQTLKQKHIDKKDAINLEIDDLQATKAGVQALIDQLDTPTP
jgi:hypothetical protein